MEINFPVTNKNINLIEDHHEALNIWRQKGFKGLDLVHIDAHIDFGFHPARPVEKILNEAKNLKELKKNLEYTLAFGHYEKDFDKQTNIGNYIYPAMDEGIVKDFYWVIPGRIKEFKQSFKIIKGMLKNFSKQAHCQSLCTLKDGIISTQLLGRKFVICILEKLPILKENTLLDIDTDFLVIDSLLNADNTSKIGKRKRWIRPDRLTIELRKKITNPVFVTVAYSVNGGWTPMRYKVLGDELAYRLSPRYFKEHYREKFIASVFFERFESTGRKEYYQKAIKLNLSYRAADNNYGPLYLSIRKFSQAKKEFLKVAKVDPKNPACLCGLGNIALENRDFKKAKGYFSLALKESRDGTVAKRANLVITRSETTKQSFVYHEDKDCFAIARNDKKGISQQSQDELFVKERIHGLLGLAQAEFNLKNFAKAKRLLLHYQAVEPMSAHSYYLLALIYEKERNFEQAVIKYKDALRLGINTLDIIKRLLKISLHIQGKDDTIQYIIIRYKQFKRWFLRTKRLSLKKNRQIKNLHILEKKIKRELMRIRVN